MKIDRAAFLSFVSLLGCKEAQTQMVVAPLEAKSADAGAGGDAGVVAGEDSDKHDVCVTKEPPKACALLKCPSPTSEDGDSSRDCERLRRTLKPAPFNRIMDCALGKSAKQTRCRSALRETEECLGTWDDKACVDDATKAECEKIVSRCKSRANTRGRDSLSLEECQAALSAVESRAHAPMALCLSESCSDEVVHDTCILR